MSTSQDPYNHKRPQETNYWMEQITAPLRVITAPLLKKPRDAGNWAQQGSNLKVTYVPTGALNLNVEGRQVAGPLQGFGQMWQKTFRVRLHSVTLTPAQVIQSWKEHFTLFWPKGNRFYTPLTGIAPGEVALIKMAMPGGMTLSTGVMVLYSDEESFTVITPQGHAFAGWNTFSAYEEDGCTVAQVQVLIRAGDPIYELGFRFMGFSKQEDVFWQHTLSSLATFFGVETSFVNTHIVCIDPDVQWSYAKNIWHNAFVRTTIYRVMAPCRFVQKLFRRRK